MRLRATILKFLLFSCVFGVVNDCFATVNTTLASTSYVDGTIQRDGNGGVLIKNTNNNPVTLSQNPQSSAVDTTSKTVTTVGWTDANRTSKVRSGGANATALVDMWIE